MSIGPSGGFAQGGWSFNYWDEELGGLFNDLLPGSFDLLLGRKTYDIFAAHWPYQSDPIADKFNAARKYVVTSSKEPLTWNNSIALAGNIAVEIARLKEGEGPDLLTQGSSELLQALLAADLIDEINLLTFPVVLGSGKRLFRPGATPSGLRLIQSTASPAGVIVSKYEPAGAIKAGSWHTGKPSDAEIVRRQKLATDYNHGNSITSAVVTPERRQSTGEKK